MVEGVNSDSVTSPDDFFFLLHSTTGAAHGLRGEELLGSSFPMSSLGVSSQTRVKNSSKH